ncbi:MAG: hypothetical protein ABFS34_10925 [Gemmatimonadota bacterium]
MSNRPSFLDELKRRKVVRVAVVYGATAFALLEAADLIVPRLELPDWTITLLLVIAILGLPLALMMAWMFDVRDGGVHRTPHADEAEGRPPAAGVTGAEFQSWISPRAAAGAGAVLVLGLTIGWLAGRSPAGSSGADERASIAVLPFTNVAQDPAALPFVDGLHDDLLTHLSRLELFRVISRTSVQDYRDTDLTIPEIATELGVGHVLEGGVQRAGDRVRLNVQLIDGETDDHLWAENYDRDLTVGDVFAIQSELSAKIAASLAEELSPEQREEIVEAQPTESLAAYDDFQRGMAFFRRSLVLEDVDRATEAFRAATRKDPGYVDAWARLAIAEATMSWEFGLRDRLALAEAAVERARERDAEHPLTHLAGAYISYYGYRDYDGALAALRRAESLRPGDPEILAPIGWVLRRQGRWDEAFAAWEAAFERDPRHFELVWASLGLSHLALGNADRARRYFALSESIAPDFGGVYGFRAALALREGEGIERAAAEIRRAGEGVALATALSYHEITARALAPRFREELLALLVDPSLEDPARAYALLEGLSLLDLAPEEAARRDSLRAWIEADASYDKIWAYQGSLPVASALVRARSGEAAQAIRDADRAVAALEAAGDAFTLPDVRYHQAAVHALAGDVDGAVDILADILEGGVWHTPATLRVDPIWDPIRDDPRFRTLADNG